jgi:hypothetical protein
VFDNIHSQLTCRTNRDDNVYNIEYCILCEAAVAYCTHVVTLRLLVEWHNHATVKFLVYTRKQLYSTFKFAYPSILE